MTISSDTLEDLQIGMQHDDVLISTSEENASVSNVMASQAVYQLDIFTHDLDPRVYDQADFIDAVRSIAVHNARSSVRILVVDSDRPTKHGHRLIELARRLSSSIEIRRVNIDYAAFPECYLIADKRGVIHRKLATRYEAVVNFNNPPLASELLGHFNEVWEHSTPEVNFKRLYI